MNEKTAAVQRMQDHISEHLTCEITLAELAGAAHYSPWYAHRLFRESVGITPSEYRLRPIPITLFIPYGVKSRDIKKESTKMKEIQTVFIQIVRKPCRRVIIKRGVKADEYWSYCAEVGCDVWGMLTSMDSLCGEPVCLWLPEKHITPNTSKYVQGVEVTADYAGSIPEGFDIITLPECEYLMFCGEPFAEEDYREAIAAVKRVMERYDPSVIGRKWDDENPRIQLEPRGERGYIEYRAIRTS